MTAQTVSAFPDGAPILSTDLFYIVRSTGVGDYHLTAAEVFALPTWIDVVFVNSWVNAGGGIATVQYYKDLSNRVWLKGSMGSGTLNTTAFTLPAGYRPTTAHIFPAYANGAFGYVTVAATGDVQVFAASNALFSVDSMSFIATQ